MTDFPLIPKHDAIMYMTSERELLATMETAYVHCRPGGVALFVPDYVRETFKPHTEHGGHDGGGRGIRYLEWSYDPDPSDTTYRENFAFILREADGTVRFEQDQYLNGLFGRGVWRRLLAEVGFDSNVVQDAYKRELFVCNKPRS